MPTLLACRIKYLDFDFRGEHGRSKLENLKIAWKRLVFEAKISGFEIPKSKEEFLKFGGSIDYYRSY